MGLCSIKQRVWFQSGLKFSVVLDFKDSRGDKVKIRLTENSTIDKVRRRTSRAELEISGCVSELRPRIC